jgi:hypothetical protein
MLIGVVEAAVKGVLEQKLEIKNGVETGIDVMFAIFFEKMSFFTKTNVAISFFSKK